jgi:hypothetical protein
MVAGQLTVSLDSLAAIADMPSLADVAEFLDTTLNISRFRIIQPR